MYARASIRYSVMQRSAIYCNTNTSLLIRHGAQLSDTFLRTWQKFKKSVVIAVRFCSAVFCHLVVLCYSMFVKLFCLDIFHICS
jgi:hypothetical protein